MTGFQSTGLCGNWSIVDLSGRKLIVDFAGVGLGTGLDAGQRSFFGGFGAENVSPEHFVIGWLVGVRRRARRKLAMGLSAAFVCM